MKKNKHKVHFSSGKDTWGTPDELFNKINAKYGPFRLDAAADINNAKAKFYLTEEENALRYDWSCFGKVWLNPPYSKSNEFVEKAYRESLKGCRVVCLIPARTDTKRWHRYVMKAKKVYFIEGRVKFVGGKASAPFPSAIVIFEKGKHKYPKFETWRQK